jgi:hypothetical protein
VKINFTLKLNLGNKILNKVLCQKLYIFIIIKKYIQNQNYLTNNCFNCSTINIKKRFYCITFMRILPVCAINFSEASRTNFLNIMKLSKFIILNKLSRNSFFNLFIPIIWVINKFNVIRHCRVQKNPYYGI